MNISAMIFAAGLGTRLYPLTADKPKALVEFNGKTLLASAIEKIIENDIHHIVVNVHHFGEQIIQFIKSNTHYDAEILISDERERLLETAGGLKHASSFFDKSDHILLYNVDILSNINLKKMLDTHLQTKALATLAVMERKSSRYFIFDSQNMALCGWKNYQTGDCIQKIKSKNPIELAFSGIHFVKQEIIELIPPSEKLSFTPFYLDLCENQKIIGYNHTGEQWRDVGCFRVKSLKLEEKAEGRRQKAEGDKIGDKMDKIDKIDKMDKSDKIDKIVCNV